MAILKPREVVLKTGEPCVVRSAEASDAPAILEITRATIREPAPFNVTLPEEFTFTVDQEKAWIAEHRDRPGWLALVAEVDDEPRGVLNFKNGDRRRLAHRGSFGMNVAQAYRGRGVGDALVRALLDWAREHPVVEKVGLAVVAGNERAIALYRKHGFVEEGRRVGELRLEDGTRVDDLLMYVRV